MEKSKFQRPKGMPDILAEDQKYFQKIFDLLKEMAKFYNFQKIETPILEQTELFSRGIGLATEIVQKEMFSLKTRDGTSLTLRPEGTAPIVRAYIEEGMENLPQPVKLGILAPIFGQKNLNWEDIANFGKLDLKSWEKKVQLLISRLSKFFLPS
jgi:histidyl-tRNA synthetase